MASPVSIIYLDVDDEITSAANRMRTATDMRIALVLPAGSRVATSRINFRLLAREAQSHQHDLSIVAPEAATRALAASAGLAVYATVRELEEALEAPGDAGEDVPAADSATMIAGGPPAPDRGRSGRGRDMARPAGDRAPEPPDETPAPGSGRPGPDARTRVGLAGRSAAADLPVVSGARRVAGPSRGWVIVVVVVLIAFVGGFLGAQFLPSATIVVTPRVETIGPLTFDVTADPTATSPDVTAAIVPASQPTIPLEASGDYAATGKKVNETKATGTVTFSNYDFLRSNTIPVGSIVATQADTQFVTRQTVILPPAALLADSSVVPQTGDSPVTAVKPGTGGNVAAGAIKIVPSGENPIATRVTNKAATSGGTHTESLIVSQKDIDKAIADLTRQLDAQLDQLVSEPGQILPDVSVFPETKSRTPGVADPDPTTLVGQAVQRFSLGMTATGTVTAVDEAAVSSLATARLRAAVGPGRDLVKDSLKVTVGKGRAQGPDIVFPVQATAQQVRRIAAADLRDAIRGKPLAQARSALEAYGETTIDLWPGFVSSIPNYDFRIDLTIQGGVPIETGNPSAAPPGRSASPRPTAASARPGASGSPKPTASGSARPSASQAP